MFLPCLALFKYRIVQQDTIELSYLEILMATLRHSQGLQRIIVIDSFIANKSMCLNVDEHANLSGTNGAGKTTCLRLIPFFYGIEPGQLENQAAGKKSFVDWYLPRATSLIIYEYARADGLCCVVIYRHPSGTKPAYRFLRGGFELDYFSKPAPNNAANFCAGSELASHWREQHLEFSSQIEVVIDYRAVLQHDRELLSRSPRAKQLRPLANRFCLGGAKKHMRHLEKVSLAILGRQGSMDKIKLMLADIMQEDGVHVPAPPKHQENKRISQDLISLRDFNRHIPEFQRVIDAYHSLQDTQKELSQLKFSLKTQHKNLTEQQTNLELSHQQQIQLKENIDSLWHNERQDIEDAIAKAKSTEKDIDSRINNLQHRYDVFEGQALEQQSKSLDNISQLNSRLEQLKNNHTRLIDAVALEQAESDKLKDKATLHYQDEKAILLAKIQLQEKQISRDQEAHLQTINALDNEHHQQIALLQTESQHVREQLIEQKSLATIAANNRQASDTQQLALNQLNNEIQSLDDSIYQHEENLSQLENKLNIAKQENEQAQSSYNHSKQQVNQALEQLEALTQQLNPNTQSWLYHLRQSDSDWQNTLAKVIKPELLFNANLNPELIDKHNSLFGWQLDLSSLPSAEIALTIEQLKLNIDKQQHDITLAETSLKEKESIAKKSQTALQALKKERESLTRQIKKLKDKKISTIASKQVLQEKIDDELNLKRTDAKQKLADIHHLLAEQQIQHSQDLTDLKEKQREEKQEKQAGWSMELSRLQQGVEVHQQALKDIKKHHSQQMKQLAHKFNELLSEKGIDNKLEKELSANIEALSLQIKSLDNNRDLIHEYRKFIQYEWPTKKALETDFNTARQTKQEFEIKLSNAKRDYQQKIRDIIQAKTQIERTLTDNNASLQEITALLNQLIIEDGGELITLPTVTLIQRATELLQIEISLSKQIHEGILRVQSEISRRTDSQIASSWQHLSQDIANRFGLSLDSSDLILKLPLALQQLIETDIPMLEKTLLETMRVIGNQLSQFYQGLRDINQRIKLQAIKISHSIENYCEIKALANIQIDMKSKIEELDYWHHLNQFEIAWLQWQNNTQLSFPDEELINQLAEVLLLLSSARVSHAISSLFELHIKMEENGRAVIIRSDNDLTNASSTGLSYLALCAIFMGITRLLCPDKSIIIHWPIDELGIIAPENISQLFAMLQSAGIVMLGGFPNTDPDLLKHFKHKHLIDRASGIKVMAVEENSLLQLIQNKTQQKTTGAA